MLHPPNDNSGRHTYFFGECGHLSSAMRDKWQCSGVLGIYQEVAGKSIGFILVLSVQSAYQLQKQHFLPMQQDVACLVKESKP